MSSEREILEQWTRQNPGLFEGLKRAISGAEGTLRDDKPGYNVMFGGGRFEDLSRHPDKVIRSPGGYSSAAAGAYQFLPGTFAEVQQKLGLKDFGQRAQDLAMLAKVRQRVPGGLAAITKAGTLTPEIQAALSPEWASFPTLSGKSYYGQPVKSQSEIERFFTEGKKSVAQKPDVSATPAQPTATDASQRGNQLGRSLLNAVMNLIPGLGRRSSINFMQNLPAYDPNQFLKAYSALDQPENFFGRMM